LQLSLMVPSHGNIACFERPTIHENSRLAHWVFPLKKKLKKLTHFVKNFFFLPEIDL
jgi:hypothetical protein